LYHTAKKDIFTIYKLNEQTTCFLHLLFFLLITIINLNAQEWQDFSMPDDTTIFHKMCNVDDYYWAIDYGYGRVFNSTDNGENWQLQYQADGDYLEAIQFLNKDIGFLSGDYGLVMKTIDGGKTWKEIGPTYTPRVTKINLMEEDSTAIGRYYYHMYFIDENQGMIWGFETFPAIGFSESLKNILYQTADGGKSWDKIPYKRGELDSLMTTFLKGTMLQQKTALGIYYANGKAYKTSYKGAEGITISNDHGQSWEAYPLPQMPDRGYMLRTIHFINEHQGYILGGNLKEVSQGYIFETLDGGKSWQSLETEFPHIHYSLQKGNDLLLAGKDGLLKKWTPTKKESKRFIHKGNTSRILIDGQVERGEWTGANKTSIKPGVDLYTLQDEHYLYFSVQYDTLLYANYYCDLYFNLGNDTLLNIHASQQLGERILTGTTWTDEEPPFNWGYINNWTANTVRYNRNDKVYLPYTALEFQISKKKLIHDHIKLALQSRDMNWEKEIINVPETGDLKSTKDWLMFYF